MSHTPVLLKEVVEFLEPTSGKKYIDATYGTGGHAKALTERGAKVLGIDRDPETNSKFQIPNFKIETGNFSEIQSIATANGFTEVDGVLFDLGMGSHQLDDPARGFSFQKDGPLDMRYDARQGKTAREILNQYPEKDLVKIFYQYGEERRFGRRVARAIMMARKQGSIETTTALFELIKRSLPAKFRFRAGDTARRIFQSLRIEVNDELGALQKALPQALGLLESGGRLAVISFHSLEDRIVKQFFKEQTRDCVCPPEFPICRCSAEATLRILTKKPITASQEEIEINPRASSAKLRVAQKL